MNAVGMQKPKEDKVLESQGLAAPGGRPAFRRDWSVRPGLCRLGFQARWEIIWGRMKHQPLFEPVLATGSNEKILFSRTVTKKLNN